LQLAESYLQIVVFWIATSSSGESLIAAFIFAVDLDDQNLNTCGCEDLFLDEQNGFLWWLARTRKVFC
jgi:hypothetical protein